MLCGKSRLAARHRAFSPVAAWASDQTAVLILAAQELRKLNFNSSFAVFLVMSLWNVPTERTF